MARRATASRLSGSMIKLMPAGAIVLAIYQYYAEAGGFQGFLHDMTHINMAVLKANWTQVGIGLALIGGAGAVSKFVPGKVRYAAEAIMIYFGASQILSVLQMMWYAPASVETPGVGSAAIGAGVRGY